MIRPEPRPPLAPAALAGTGLLLLFITWAEAWPVPLLARWLGWAARRFPWFARMLDRDDQAPTASEPSVR